MPTVLVVDDSSVDRRLVRGLVERAGNHKVLESCDGADALQQLARRPIDAVITDLQMPIMDGLELVRAIKEEYPFVPVILITGRGSEEIAVRALQAGAASYVPKVQLTNDLCHTLERVLAATQQDRSHSRLMHHLAHGSLGLVLPNELGLIRSTVNLLQQMLRCLPLGDETERLRVGLALDEALKNAYYHGNLEVVRGIPLPKRDAWDLIAFHRRLQVPYRNRRIYVEARVDRLQATFVIRDDGQGFDQSHLPAPDSLQDQGEPAARGISLMRTIMDEVRFNPAGNEVTLVKRAVSVEELPGESEAD